MSRHKEFSLILAARSRSVGQSIDDKARAKELFSAAIGLGTYTNSVKNLVMSVTKEIQQRHMDSFRYLGGGDYKKEIGEAAITALVFSADMPHQNKEAYAFECLRINLRTQYIQHNQINDGSHTDLLDLVTDGEFSASFNRSESVEREFEAYMDGEDTIFDLKAVSPFEFSMEEEIDKTVQPITHLEGTKLPKTEFPSLHSRQ